MQRDITEVENNEYADMNKDEEDYATIRNFSGRQLARCMMGMCSASNQIGQLEMFCL